MRSHSAKNGSQHAKFLGKIGESSTAHTDAISWFRTLPVWLDLPRVRVVHACWHHASREALMPFLDEGACFTEDGMLESYRHGSAAHLAVEILLKGPEEHLPPGLHFFDKDGHRREEVRTLVGSRRNNISKGRPWDGWGKDEIPDSELPKDYRYHGGKPVFFGHYRLRGQSAITAPNAV